MEKACPSTLAVIEKEAPAPVKVSWVVDPTWRAAGDKGGAAATRPARAKLLKTSAVDNMVID